MIPLYFRVKWFLFQERREVRRRFPSFIPFERALKRAYRFCNPYRLCPDVYGETPLPLLSQIGETCGLSGKDVLFELGCGRGRGTLFLSHRYGCKAVGIDRVSFFIQTAKKIGYGLPIEFQCENMLNVDLTGATVIYLYGTCLADEMIAKLSSKFEKLSFAAQIVTVSYPLCDYSSAFVTTKQFTGLFPWGEGEIYVNQRSPLSSACSMA